MPIKYAHIGTNSLRDAFVEQGTSAMRASAVFAFLHFVAVFGIAATGFVEWQTMRPQPTYAEARRIRVCDRWYGIFELLLLLGMAFCASLMARGFGV
ncbi:MAG TPA: DUF2214 family protein [Burkholderiaceae bacterium]|nr:DUF2214 family protein [Burkholderiaceae bacterium]